MTSTDGLPPPVPPPPGPAPSVRFDHRDPGTAAGAWQPMLASIPEAAWPDPETHIVVLAAHPDDETLGCGAILAHATAAGNPLTVIIASDGERSHPQSSTHRPEQLAVLRRAEARGAVTALAPNARLVQLGLPDGHLDRQVPALVEATVAELTDGATWLLAPWGQDRHPDHAACAQAARRAADRHPRCAVAEYPLWAWHWGSPGGTDLPVDAMRRVSGGTHAAERRFAALRHYRSQVDPLSDRSGDEALLHTSFLAHFARDDDVLIDPKGSAARAEYFDALYDLSDDPWGAGTRWYERRKRAVLLASLPRREFVSAFEPGCAAGHLTVQLGRRCRRLLSVDTAARAVQLAATRTADISGVRVQRLAIPAQWPAERFDLVVLSEIAYYIADLPALATRVMASLTDDGVVVLCHWRHPATEHVHSAETVHRVLREQLRLNSLACHGEPDFLLDVLSVDDSSVARADGLLD